jgi:hypothetical protein
MTTRIATRRRIVDSILYLSLLLENQPRLIDRYIDYFGGGHQRRPNQSAAK